MCRCASSVNGPNSSLQEKIPKTRYYYYKNSSTTHKSRSGKDGECGSKSSSLRKRCVGAVKERRARLCIITRCLAILLCWHRYEDA
ncbi:hypothetical protein SUGI_0809090 [Cryptomeria japonica]|nr:hypothetical protein SUGI_0809090 [Cryptomeria japonica]